jgi:hypothetical protein
MFFFSKFFLQYYALRHFDFRSFATLPINLLVRETNRYAEQYLLTHKPSKRSKTLQWEPITKEEMLKFWGIIIEMGLVQMPKVDYYWSKSQLYESKVIQNTGWAKSHFTEKKIKYLCYGSSKRAHFFASNKGMFTLHIHKDKASENLS